jgi:hypothetical protein
MIREGTRAAKPICRRPRRPHAAGATGLCAPPQERSTHPTAQLLRHPGSRRGGRIRLHHGGVRGLGGFARREPGKLLGCQLLRLGVDRFGRRTVKGNTLVMAKYGLAVDWRHFPGNKDAKRVRKRPAHCRSNLMGSADRKRTNVLMLSRKRERPFLPEHRELLARLLCATISLDLICRWHGRFPLRYEATR